MLVYFSGFLTLMIICEKQENGVWASVGILAENTESTVGYTEVKPVGSNYEGS